MLTTTAGQVLINEALPKELRDYSRTLDKKGTKKLLQEVAEKYPDQYREIAKSLSDIGYKTAYQSGGYSFGIQHLLTYDKVRQAKAKLKTDIDTIVRDRKLTDKEKDKRVIDLIVKRTPQFEKLTMEEAVKRGNPLAYQILSGARGNPGNLRGTIGGDLLYEDHRGRPIPIPVLSSYAQGLTPLEYWAGTFGARKGLVDLKFATQDAGFFGKQLNQASHRLVVTDYDRDDKDLIRGMPVDTDDVDNEGTLLAMNTGKFKRNTVLTPKMLAALKAAGHKRILIKSPILGGPPQGGVYATDVGMRERGGIPSSGDNVGVAAASALAEPVTQAQIGSKHAGGVAGAGGATSGFKYINQVAQVPKTFAGGAAHAQTDGRVSSIYEAPAGGKYVVINGEQHYVGVGFKPTVRVGQTIEAGDTISDGLPNPSEIVRYKGIGEGRRYFINIMRDILQASGIPGHRRNIELLARGLINHVRLTDEMGEYITDDIVPFDIMEHSYEPREGFEESPAARAIGKYLERPVLHYSIGTKVRPSMLKQFKEFGVNKLTVHKEPPPFEPVMIRAMENLSHDPDWMTRQLGSGLQKGLLQAAHRGARSDELGTSYVPNLAKAVDFGRVGLTKSWDSKKLKKINPEDQTIA